MTLFFRQYRAELYKLFARKRTWMGFGAFVVLEILILIMIQLPRGERFFRRDFEKNIGFLGEVFSFDYYFRGLTVAAIVIAFTMILLGALYLSLVGGDMMSKEAEDGTLRMTLCRPVSRLRVLAVKYLTCLTYTFILVSFIGGSAILIGWAWRGLGGMFVFVPEEQLFAIFDTETGLMRLIGLIGFYALSLCTVMSLAFMLSCTTAKPAAATVLTLSITLIDYILFRVPYFAGFKEFFINYRMATCLGMFRDPIPWDRMLVDYLYLFGVNATFFIIGCALFCRRDFKS